MKAPEKVSLAGLTAVYNSLHAHQLALYHGVPLEVAQRIKAERLTAVPANTPIWRDVFSIGGYRSGKTFAACYKLLRHMMRQGGSMALVVRKHHEQMKNTFIYEFFKVADFVTRCLDKNYQPIPCLHTPSGGDVCHGHANWILSEPKEQAGSVEVMVQAFNGRESKVVFRIEPEGDAEKIKKSFGGYELSAFVMEEAGELIRETYDAGTDRLSWSGGTMCIVLSNPVYAGHWLAELRAECEGRMLSFRTDREESETNQRPVALIIRSTTEDNLTHLPANYLEDQKRKYADRPVEYEMFLMGYDGVKVEGRPVFAGQFRRELHVVECQLNPHRPLIRGWDFGYHNPACVFMQMDDQGCLNVLAEYREKEIYIEQFVDAVKAFTVRTFPVLLGGIVDYGDYAGTQETDKQGTSIQRANARGVKIMARPNAKVENGLNQIRKLMRTNTGPRCRFQVHPRCQELISAMAYGYHYQVYNNGQVAFAPKKDNKWDHIVDALRYGVVNLFGIDDTDGATTGKRGSVRARVSSNYLSRDPRDRSQK